MLAILCIVCLVQFGLNIGLVFLYRSEARENDKLRLNYYNLLAECDKYRSLYAPFGTGKYRTAYSVVRQAIGKIQSAALGLLLDLKSIGLADDGSGNPEIIVESADIDLQSVSYPNSSN